MDILDYPKGAVVLDATIGQAGHAVALADRLDEKGLLIGLDVDAASLETSRQRLKEVDCRVELRRVNFADIAEVLSELGIAGVDVLVADLGVSSVQWADSEKGLSFQVEGRLDMRLDDRLERTAGDLVNKLGERELADLIWQYGQERKSRRIARWIVRARQEKALETTSELAAVIQRALGIKGEGRKSKIHPATRTFQALRIAVNDELGQLDHLLEVAPRVLKKAGQIAVISFHSLEDGRVKKDFRKNKVAGNYEILTGKPIIANEAERKANRRSRSAKLRVARRI